MRQLFINLSNEILQSHFNQHFFRMELQARALHVATLLEIWMDILHLPDRATLKEYEAEGVTVGIDVKYQESECRNQPSFEIAPRLYDLLKWSFA